MTVAHKLLQGLQSVLNLTAKIVLNHILQITMAGIAPVLPGKTFKIIPNVKKSQSVAIDKDGFIYAAVSEDHEFVNVYDQEGTKIKAIGAEEVEGYTFYNFSSICGVAISKEGHVLVTDSNRLRRITPEGQLELLVGSHLSGDGPLELNTPARMAIHPSTGQIYVADQYNYRIQVFNSDFTYSHSIGEKGVQPGQLYNPQDVALDSKGNVYVVNSTINCIDVFTPKGKHIRRFGKEGSGKGELYFPTSIAIDANDFIYVSEYDNHRISIFDSKGKFIDHYGRWGKGEGEFDVPRSIAFDNSGRLYVCDYNNSRIVIID